MISLEVDTLRFGSAFESYVRGTGRDAREAALMSARIFMRNVIAITPPGDGAQAGERAALTKADEKRARAAILGDLARLFIPVRLRNKRPEEWPDVEGLHRHAFITGKTAGKSIKRVGNKKYVDQRKLRALSKKLFSRIGRLAAEWLAGAFAVGLKGLPAWLRRHGTGGAAKISAPDAPRFHFEAINPRVPSELAGELDRRIRYAGVYTANNLRRQLDAVLDKRGREFSRAA